MKRAEKIFVLENLALSGSTCPGWSYLLSSPPAAHTLRQWHIVVPPQNAEISFKLFSSISYFPIRRQPVTMSEEQQVAIGVQGVSPVVEKLSDRNNLIRQGHKTIDTRMSFGSVVALYVCCYSLFYGIWHGIYGCGESPTACIVICLSRDNILIYWALISVDCQKDDSSLSCIV